MAIFGVGIDLVNVGRVRAALDRYPERFRNRVFTPDEVRFCETLGDKYPSYAGRFAAKEAFSKALGTGLRGAIGWTEIDVCDNERSRPTIRVTGRAEKILAGRKVHLSISHLPDYATAIVIIEDWAAPALIYLPGRSLTAGTPDLDWAMLWQYRISSDPRICSGKPCIKGTRIPVHIILDLLAAGETFAGIKKAYPDIKEEDVQACIGYAAMLAEEEAGVTV